jgi:hypothetical protein
MRINNKPIRVILANRPRLFREMLQHVLKKDVDLEVVAEIVNLDLLPEVIYQTSAHWVLISLLPNGKLPFYIDLLMNQYPQLSVLALAGDGSKMKVKSGNEFEASIVGASLKDLLMIMHTFLHLNHASLYSGWNNYLDVTYLKPESLSDKWRLN